MLECGAMAWVDHHFPVGSNHRHQLVPVAFPGGVVFKIETGLTGRILAAGQQIPREEPDSVEQADAAVGMTGGFDDLQLALAECQNFTIFDKPAWIISAGDESGLHHGLQAFLFFFMEQNGQLKKLMNMGVAGAVIGVGVGVYNVPDLDGIGVNKSEQFTAIPARIDQDALPRLSAKGKVSIHQHG